MEKVVCETCQEAKTTMRCGLCGEPSCKTCSQILDEDAFSFFPQTADELKKGVYCHACFEAKVAGPSELHDKTMAAARAVDIYFKDQGKETRLMPRAKNIKYTIHECADRDELILRLAFLAAFDGYSTLVDVDIIGNKVREGSYQKTIYQGTAVPVETTMKERR